MHGQGPGLQEPGGRSKACSESEPYADNSRKWIRHQTRTLRLHRLHSENLSLLSVDSDTDLGLLPLL